MESLAQILILLGVAVAVVVIFQRLHIPTSLGYLLVGLILGPHTVGPVVDVPEMRGLAEFGIVFLLFTIGLNFSLPQLHKLRNQVLGLGTAQVALTTLVIALGAWLAGMPAAAAFVVGAVVAQSSTTIIGKQLADQNEENSRHGRLGIAMSVFQDVTAVPFVVVIPVLGLAATGDVIAGALFWALAKAVLAFVLVFVAGRWLLHPLFHLIAERRSPELFTLTVLLVALLAAWTTNSLGLSLAFGAFLAGMMLGETEFRHQVEATIRPFRDVLLGLFFIGIGMLVDPQVLARIWHWALAGALAMLVIKTILVTLIVRFSGLDIQTALRTGLLLAVGGEFGFAVLAIALDSQVIATGPGQVLLSSVLFSMIAAPVLIRFNHVIARALTGRRSSDSSAASESANLHAPPTPKKKHVIICGFGRIGQGVAHLLEEEGIPYTALDLDPSRVKEARTAGEPVFYGDASVVGVLDGIGIADARLVVIAHEDVSSAIRTLAQIRHMRPELPVMVRTRDETHVGELQAAGALEVVPETQEASLMIASQALLLLDVPRSRVMRRIQEQRSNQYRLMREFFRGDELSADQEIGDLSHLRSIVVSADSRFINVALEHLDLVGMTVTALVRKGERHLTPALATRLMRDDVLVVFGPVEKLEALELTLNR